MIKALLVGCVALAFGVVAADDELKARDQQDLVEEYIELDEWSTAGRERRDAIVARLSEVAPLDAGDIKKWAKRIEKHWSKGLELEKDSGTHYLYPDATPTQARGKYIVGGETNRPKGLLIAMHGGGLGSGDAEPMAKWYDNAAKERKLVMIAPEVLEKTERGWTDAGT